MTPILSEKECEEMRERINRYANCIVFIEPAVAADAKAEFLAITARLLSTVRAQRGLLVEARSAIVLHCDECAEHMAVAARIDSAIAGEGEKP